jgi:hypothetical protein
MNTTAKSDEPVCWTCYDHGIRRVATREFGSLGPIWCVECFFAITDRRCLLEVLSDKPPEGATLQ